MKTWLHLKVLLSGLERDTGYGKIDALTQRMLEWIAIRTHERGPLYIQEIVARSEIASPATIYKSLTKLLDGGFITVNVDAIDSRRRIVEITEYTDRLLTELSRGVERWGKSLSTGRKDHSPRNDSPTVK